MAGKLACPFVLARNPMRCVNGAVISNRCRRTRVRHAGV